MRLQEFNLTRLTEGIYNLLQKTSNGIKTEIYLGSRLEERIMDEMHCTHEDVVAAVLELRSVGLIEGREDYNKFRDFYTIISPEDIKFIPVDRETESLSAVGKIRSAARDKRDMQLVNDAVKEVTGFNSLKDYLLDIKHKEGRFHFNRDRVIEVADICELSGVTQNRIKELMLNITFALNPVNAGDFV